MSAEKIVKAFCAFHAANPAVYELFKRFSFEAMAAGHKRFSSDMIMHRIRWETSVATSSAGWNMHSGRPLKINNNFSAWYSRLFALEHPAHSGFFQTRKIQA